MSIATAADTAITLTANTPKEQLSTAQKELLDDLKLSHQQISRGEYQDAWAFGEELSALIHKHYRHQ